MDTLSPLLKLAVAVGLALVLWPLARKAGRADAGRMGQLGTDLRGGRPMGLAVVAVVVALIVLTNLSSAT